MMTEDYDTKIKYLSAKAKRQGGRLTFEDAVEYHEALISQLQLESLRQGQEIGRLKAKVETLEEEK